jgi:predicted DNA binding protein
MKYLRCVLRFPESVIHPVHRFIGEHDAVVKDQLLHGNTMGDDWDTFLFYVEGDSEAYASALAATPQIHEYEIIRIDSEDSFYAYVTQEANEIDEQLFDTFSRSGVIVVPPVDFLSDGTARLTIVGESDALQSSLAAVPDEIQLDVERVGEYDGTQATFDPELTDRQLEAVAAAVETGYYAVPRRGTITEISDELGCASGTASEHLRKAEQKVMESLVALRSTP